MNTPTIGFVAVVLAVMPVVTSVVRAQEPVKLASVFTDNMVLQRDKKVPVWGWCKAGEKVSVSIGTCQADATAGPDGKWMTQIGPLAAGGPYAMTIAYAGTTTTLTNILAGEVWLCSGQSNMEMALATTKDPQKDIETAKYPNIRLYSVPKRLSVKPLNDIAATWQVCSPQTVPGFSTVGYAFGRKLHTDLNVPVGLIQSAFGGSPIEPWIAPCGYAKTPELKALDELVATAEDKYKQAVLAHFKNTEAWMATARQELDAGKTISPQPGMPMHPLGYQWQSPTTLFNGMISALIPYGMRGVIWYQGESNNGDGMIYFEKMKALIGGWRELWGEGDFPFYYVQLAPLNSFYGEGRLPALWEAQTAALVITNTGMVVTTDIGNLESIDVPNNKQDVGARLALWALARTYGQQGLVYSGPLYKSMTVEGGKIRIAFDYIGGGLAARDGKELDWFEIAGDDKKFVKANAVIDGNTVVVSAAEVAAPVAVRFGWKNIATPNLMNKEALPASPFRTDKW